MELKAGYKQTEVGVIPEEWNVHAIDSFAMVTAGGTPSRQVADLWDGEIPWVTTTEINWNTIREIPQSITAKGLDNSAAKLIAPEALLIALYGQGKTRGKVAILGIQAATNQACAAIVISPAVSRKFVFHFLVSQYSAIRALSNSGSQENLSGGIVKSILIPLPPTKVEQEAIAEALSDADVLIESLDQLITKKRQIKQGVMQELLTGKRRLPGFSKAWAETTIKKIVQTPVTDGPHMTPRFLDDGIPFLSVNNLVDNKIDFSDLRYISAANHEEFSRKCKPRKNDLLLGKAASVGKVAIVETEIDFNIWSPIALIRVNSNNYARYVYYQLQSVKLNKQIALLTNSSSQGNIGMGDIERLVLPLPEIDEQTAIATVLSDIDTELAALESRIAKARQVKQGMMRELLTGRIRLL